MKTDANWLLRNGAFALVLMMLFAALSCGGGGTGTVDLNPSARGPGGTASGGDVVKSTAPLITEEEIATLPAWQQELLSDPGWNQPYIPPREGTPIEPPTYEMLMDETQKALEKGMTIVLPGEDDGRSVSWNDQGNYVPPANVAKAEYETLVPGGDPDWGCNNDGSNGVNNHALDDVINLATISIPQRISWVEEGWTTPNHFNATGGAGNDALSAVYQLFSTDREADPTDPDNTTAEFGELAYRSDLAPGVPPGGNCSAATAYAVTGWFWREFNSMHDAMPSMQPTPLRNLLVAPSDEISALYTSSGGTDGRFQPFYFGTVTNCYGGGWIFGLESSASTCQDFNDYVVAGSATGFFVRPIYGVLLKRWQATQVDQITWDGPWDGPLGWPVFGPVAYANGSQVLTAHGTYYAWGMWFEKGFLWWVDYDQAMFPNTPDEAQLYRWTGDNVYCRGPGDSYRQVAPTVYYGGSGDLSVSVVVEAYRYQAADPWTAAPLSADGTYYEIGLPGDDGLGTVNVSMFAQGYGGHPKDDVTYGDCMYKYYIWAFRDGTIQAAGAAYDPAQRYVSHTYGNLLRNLESVYVVRVQVTDGSFDLGLSPTEVHGYGDSLPIHLGHGGGAGGEVLLVRNDGGNYDTNYDALRDDLDALGVSYNPMDYNDNIATTYVNGGYRVCIWYRGGPGAGGETQPYTTTWTTAEMDNLYDILNTGTASSRRVLHFSQGHQTSSRIEGGGWYLYWYAYYGCSGPNPSNNATIARMAGDIEGYRPLGEQYGVYSGNIYISMNVQAMIGQPAGMTTGAYSSGCAERQGGAGTSGDVPITFGFGNHQFCTRGRYQPFDNDGVSNQINPDFQNGITGQASSGWFGSACLSYGYENGPGTAGAGQAKYWCVGYSWNDMAVTASSSGSMTREDVLHNMLGYLDPGLSYGTGGGGGSGFTEYDGVPEIVQVTPISWFGSGGTIDVGTTSVTGMHYPDSSGTDVYRDSQPAGGNYIVHTRPAIGGPDYPNPPVEAGLNANDIDFQFPFYAYIYDPDGSLTSGTGYDYGGGVVSAVSGDEVLAMGGGLLVEDPASNWTRVDPGLANYADFDTNVDTSGAPNADDAPDPPVDNSDWLDIAGWDLPPVAGYYVTTTADPYDVGGEVRAIYGTLPANLDYQSTSEPLTFEAIAHWPETLTYFGNPAYLGWSLYPGHTTFVYNTGAYYGEDVSWQGFVATHDIDPTVPTAPTGRDDENWLNYDFNYTQLIANGRVVEFDYSNINGWNGDINKSGTAGDNPGDKFPVSCRLYTDIANFTHYRDGSYLYPNHWPDTDTFIQGGCYIVDASAGGGGGPPGLILEETPMEIQPGFNLEWIGTYPTAPEWQVECTFTLDVGSGPANIFADLDADPLDPTTQQNDILPGDMTPPAFNLPAGTHTVTFTFTPDDLTGYAWSNGDQMYLGLHATNAAGDDYAVYNTPLWWGDVCLFENFEPPFAQADLLPINGAWFGWDDDRDAWRFWKEDNYIPDEGWVAAPTSRSWITNPAANLGTQGIFCDDGSEYSGGGYWRPFLAPQVQVETDDYVYHHLRRAMAQPVGNRLCPCGYITSGGVFDGNFGWVYLAEYGMWDDGNHLTPEISTINNGDWMETLAGWGWRTNDGYICFGQQMYYFYAGQGTFFDNWLYTHADNYPPYM